jgi:hypothetical protein
VQHLIAEEPQTPPPAGSRLQRQPAAASGVTSPPAVYAKSTDVAMPSLPGVASVSTEVQNSSRPSTTSFNATASRDRLQGISCYMHTRHAPQGANEPWTWLKLNSA